jgi:hypothetical protein
MQDQNFTTSITVNQTPEFVYNALLNVRGWWSGLFGETFEGQSEKTGDVFSFRAGDGAHYSKQQLVTAEPNKKIVWRVRESSLSFVEKTHEWEGTQFGFDISEEDGKTKIAFTHKSLTPELECYNSCAPAWTGYINEQKLNLEKP